MTETLAGGLILVGVLLALLAAIGVLRLPDVFTRMQASTKALTLGLGCLLAGHVLLHPSTETVIRAVSIAAFIMLTAPVSAHVIARAAARTGAPLWIGTHVDERPVEGEEEHGSVPERVNESDDRRPNEPGATHVAELQNAPQVPDAAPPQR
jgi:multicomponent Na+:H+ antiporter subunit G